MRELIALNVVILTGFVLGSFFGAGVYHAILKVFKKGEPEVKSALSEIKEYLLKAKSEVVKVAEDVKDGLPHA